jgi:hypothetical protein
VAPGPDWGAGIVRWLTLRKLMSNVLRRSEARRLQRSHNDYGGGAAHTSLCLMRSISACGSDFR